MTRILDQFNKTIETHHETFIIYLTLEQPSSINISQINHSLVILKLIFIADFPSLLYTDFISDRNHIDGCFRCISKKMHFADFDLKRTLSMINFHSVVVKSIFFFAWKIFFRSVNIKELSLLEILPVENFKAQNKPEIFGTVWKRRLISFILMGVKINFHAKRNNRS